MGDVVPFISKREIELDAELLKAEIALWEMHKNHLLLIRTIKDLQQELTLYKELSTSRLLRIIELEPAHGQKNRRPNRSPEGRV
jgi:hypothetical protein